VAFAYAAAFQDCSRFERELDRGLLAVGDGE
jgi:hypothetical protein